MDKIQGKDRGLLRVAGRGKNLLLKLLPAISFAVAMSILYSLDPGLFEKTWIGRTFYIFFMWLVILEMILNWEELKTKLTKVRSTRTALLIALLALPTIYVVVANYYGFNAVLENTAKQYSLSDHQAKLMRLPFEYLVFTVAFGLMALALYGVCGLARFSSSILFLGVIGSLYMIDNLYPGGAFTPFQAIVPATTVLSANVLNMMGYSTTITYNYPGYGTVPLLRAWNSVGSIGYGIAWACSGIESLLIYSVVVLLFLRMSSIPRMHKIIYFAVGAIVTYLINILRIVTIYVVMINNPNLEFFQSFHDYYGPLYSVAWITCYPLLIIGTQSLWGRIRTKKTAVGEDLKPKLKQIPAMLSVSSKA